MTPREAASCSTARRAADSAPARQVKPRVNPTKPPDERPAGLWDVLITSDWAAAAPAADKPADPHALEGYARPWSLDPSLGLDAAGCRRRCRRRPRAAADARRRRAGT